MKIAVDAMGGDLAPYAPVQGAIEAIKILPPGDEIILVGRGEMLYEELRKSGVEEKRISVLDAPDVIGMDESPTSAISHKRQASIPKGYQLIKNGGADAFIGAGNTGAMLVGAIYTLNTIPGIIRPCIPSFVPRSDEGYSLILDVGSNPDAKPDVLYQYAIIGSVYANLVMGIEDPKVALLNIGEEEEKGNLLTQATYRIMKGNPDFRFTGNIEARNIFSSQADVIVCDGFTGNIVLKLTEGFFSLLMDNNISNPLFQKFNYENYGGTPILGVNGIAMIAHGISSPNAFKTMFLETRKVFDSDIVNELKTALKRFID